MIDTLLQQTPHRRWNPLKREWVLVSPNRTKRPWLGQTEEKKAADAIAYEPSCYLCPGNARAGGAINPRYEGTFSFVNDYSALLPDSSNAMKPQNSPLLLASPAPGVCKVLCYHPDHSLTLAQMTQPEIRRIVDAWTQEYQQLGGQDWIEYVQIFENCGAMMGCSNPHPHGQIWATGFVPDETAAESEAQREYLSRTGHCLLCDYLARERTSLERVVFENDHFAIIVPWWAVWPFEVLLISRRHLGAMPELSDVERDGLADALKRLTTRFDNLFETSFPYTMGFHQSPTSRTASNGPISSNETTGGEAHPEWHFHAHFYPPLLRSATVRKFMVGFEMLGMPQRDITPEESAQRLRACSEQHFWPRG